MPFSSVWLRLTLPLYHYPFSLNLQLRRFEPSPQFARVLISLTLPVILILGGNLGDGK